MKADPNTRQYRSDMGKLRMDFAAGMFVKGVIMIGVIYGVLEGYTWIKGVFAPVTAALGGN